MQSLQDILNQELILFRAALDTERRKRRAIQSADGKRLNELTAKSEIFLKEAQGLEAQREQIVRSLMDRYGASDPNETLTLRRLVRIMEEAAPVESLGLGSVADEFRSTVFALKRESIANNELMSNTQKRIHRLLTGITDPDADGTYTPAGNVKKDRAGKALLLNANA
jgi:flagellar biosynthesis/type III secretory pathway chaperone